MARRQARDCQIARAERGPSRRSPRIARTSPPARRLLCPEPMTLIPLGLLWPRPSMILLLVAGLGFGGGWLAHPSPPLAPVGRCAVPRPVAMVRPADSTLPPLAIAEVQHFHYRVLRAALARELDAPHLLGASCRIVPTIHDARPAGFKLYAIRPNSLFARLGLQNGDRIVRINGTELTTPDRALEIYTQVRQARLVRVDVERRGVPTQLVYDVID